MKGLTAANNAKSTLSTRGKAYFKEQLIPLIVLLGIIIIASLVSPVFLSWTNIKNIMVQIAMYMVVTMGMLFVILTGGIDLSVGSILAIAGVFVAGLMKTMPAGLAILITLLIATAVGAVNGLIVARLKIAAFIVTMGMQSLGRGIAYWYTESTPISWTSFEGAGLLRKLGSDTILGVPWLTVVWIIVVFISFLLLRYTVLGRVMYAIGGNEEAVRLSGLDVGKWKVFPYAFSGLCCGIGGILLTARLGVGAPTSGDGMELDCIAAAVIGGASLNGGKGSITGAVIGSFVLMIINNILDLMNVLMYPQLILKGAIVVVAVIFATIREKKTA